MKLDSQLLHAGNPIRRSLQMKAKMPGGAGRLIYQSCVTGQMSSSIGAFMKVRLVVIAIVLVGLLSLLPIGSRAAETGGPFQYPVARKSDQVDDYHGTKVADPY